MKNWKIGIRIMAGFAAVIVITAILGVFALSRVGDVEHSSQLITSTEVPKQHEIAIIVRDLHHTYHLGLAHAWVDKKDKPALDAQIQNLRKENGEQMILLDKQMESADDRALFQEFKASRAAYWTSMDELLKISSSGAENAQAFKYAMEKVRPLQEV